MHNFPSTFGVHIHNMLSLCSTYERSPILRRVIFCQTIGGLPISPSTDTHHIPDLLMETVCFQVYFRGISSPLICSQHINPLNSKKKITVFNVCINLQTANIHHGQKEVIQRLSLTTKRLNLQLT